MEAQSIQEYERLERYYWWFVGRRHIIESFLKKYFPGNNRRILDWGCGPGGNFGFLQKHGSVLGVDASDESLSACARKGISSVVKAAHLGELSVNESFDLVTNFDVLEHISQDEQFLRDVRRFLNPGGRVLVTVPAYRFLWTGLDEALGHKRRYTRKELCEKIERAGFHILRASYFVCLLSPAFIAYRMLGKLKKSRTTSLGESVVVFPGPINWLFTKILYIEAIIMLWVNLPFGTSIIVLARKGS